MGGKTGIMICGHGSRNAEAVLEFESLARGMRARLPDLEVESGFLEFARPMIREGLESLKQRGVDDILAVPAMLFAAGHVKNDIPWELNSFASENPEISVSCARDLSIEPMLLAAARDRIEAAEKAAQEAGESGVPRGETLLMVAGRGTNDPDANANISKIARMLWEGMGFGWAEACYSGVAHPRVDEGLERVMRLGFRRVIVFPYFLFTGILVKRIYQQTDEVAARHPGSEFVKAGYLNDHPLVLDSLAARVEEISAGENVMNCLLCKYREQVIGYETDQGTPQAGHHHHVRGIGVDGDPHGHLHGHHHDHGHDHKKAASDAHFDYLRDPREITKRSFETILGEVDFTLIPDDLLSVAVRLVHACATPEITNDIAWSEGAAAAGQAALKAGAPIFCDSDMVAKGIISSRLAAGNEIVCALNDPGVAARAAADGITRSAAAVETWKPRLDGAVVAIGNAPTALFRLLEIIGEGGPKPAIILGFPVGFIGAAESKEALIREGTRGAAPFITLRGRRGGSALAAAAVNALARSAFLGEGEDEEETLFAHPEKR